MMNYPNVVQMKVPCDVEADALVRVLVHKADQLGDNVQLQQQVNGISLSVVSQEKWCNLQCELDKVLCLSFLLLTSGVLQSNLSRQMSNVSCQNENLVRKLVQVLRVDLAMITDRCTRSEICT